MSPTPLTSSSADLDPAARRLGFTLLRKPLDLGRPKLALADSSDQAVR